jgi:predicted DsbA family dithiol-disulfide isomerase
VTEKRSASVDFFADLTCPWCYVGWESLKRATEARPDLALNLAWRNFLLNPDAPREGYDRRAYLEAKFTDRERLKTILEALAKAAQAANAMLHLDAPTRLPNTIDAHRLIHWAAGQGQAEAAIDRLFSVYWIEGRDIGEAATLAQIASDIGLDAALVLDLLAGDADRDTILKLHDAAVRLGVTGVPVAIINGKALVIGAESPENYGKALDKVAVAA